MLHLARSEFGGLLPFRIDNQFIGSNPWTRNRPVTRLLSTCDNQLNSAVYNSFNITAAQVA